MLTHLRDISIVRNISIPKFVSLTQKIKCASLPCQLLPRWWVKKLQENLLYSSCMRMRTRPASLGPSRIYSFQTTDRNSGPVEYITVMYGRSQWRSYCCSTSIVRRKNGCCGTEPIASLEIPVGAVRRTQAG